VKLTELTDEELIAHVRTVIDHAHARWEHHFWLHGYDLGPIGLLLHTCTTWGLPLSDVIPLLEGASPSTTAPVEALRRIRESVAASGHEPASLDELRQISPDVAADLDRYLRYRGALLFSRYDIDGVTLGERPDLILATIMSGQERRSGLSVDERIAELRSRVEPEHRAEFDERLGEARAAMNLRDDNGPTNAEWPLGLVRLALLEVGRRMAERGHITKRELALEVTPEEIDGFLLSGRGPASAELARRAAERHEQAKLHPPTTLGTPEPAPPLEVLPPSMARLVAVVQIVMNQLGMAGDRDALGTGLKGAGVGHQSYRGIARRASSPEEALDTMAPGEVLIVPFTTPAYNVVLSIAGAIVTAVGGPLSHAAVLARELGIPAVIGAPRALLDIEDGADVEVDPVAGEVRLLGES
jgi:pyruvate,water dikinase